MSVRSGGDHDLVILSGSAHPRLASRIAGELGVSLMPMTVSRFPDSEIHVRVEASVRGKDVYVIQPTCPPVNETFTELLIILDALRRASTGRITAVIPYYGYARQDKKTAGREPITARMVADMLTKGGADRILTVDLHSPQIQGFFDIPVDQLTAVGVLSEHMRKWDLRDSVIVAPDAGRVNMASEYAGRLNLPVAIVQKRRIGAEKTQAAYVVGEVEGKRPIIIDDMITTGGTVAGSMDALIKRGCRPEIRVAATHAVLVGKSVETLSDAAIAEVVVTDTVPFDPARSIPALKEVSVAPLIAQAIGRIHADDSVSDLFGDRS